MELEREIDVELHFADEHEKVMVNLVYTYNVFLGRTLNILKPFTINDQHYNILKILDKHAPQPVSVGELDRLRLNNRGDLTRLLDKLCAMGLIVRETNPENRRVVLVRISEQGSSDLRAMDAALDTQRDPRATLSTDEARLLNQLLDKLRG
jgi:DNA-binding MarR family transcriptional regulator